MILPIYSQKGPTEFKERKLPMKVETDVWGENKDAQINTKRDVRLSEREKSHHGTRENYSEGLRYGTVNRVFFFNHFHMWGGLRLLGRYGNWHSLEGAWQSPWAVESLGKRSSILREMPQRLRLNPTCSATTRAVTNHTVLERWEEKASRHLAMGE